MLIIFEGNEGVGKSSLAKMLADTYSTNVMKRASHKDTIQNQIDNWGHMLNLNDSALYDWRFLLEMLEQQIASGKMFIADRSFITQAVYHSAFWPEEYITDVHRKTYEALCKILLELPHIVFHIERNQLRLDDETVNSYTYVKGDVSPFEAISSEYKEFYENNENLNVHKISNNSTLSEAFDKIQEIYIAYSLTDRK